MLKKSGRKLNHDRYQRPILKFDLRSARLVTDAKNQMRSLSYISAVPETYIHISVKIQWHTQICFSLKIRGHVFTDDYENINIFSIGRHIY